jgi:hypothetical protein
MGRITFFTAFILLVLAAQCYSFVVEEKGRTYIVDRPGERWDVTQAVTLGFKPERFQYGIGRDAFTPLDESYLRDDPGLGYSNLRVIGVTEGDEAHAYSVQRLVRHEIANSRIGQRHIAVGY